MKIIVMYFLMRIVSIILLMFLILRWNIKVLKCEKREDCILLIHTIRLLALPTQMDKQQPLTPCEYIVLPLGIVYIRSVSVVATRPLSIFKFCENLIVRASFNNALSFLCPTTFRKSITKVRKNAESYRKNERFLLFDFE